MADTTGWLLFSVADRRLALHIDSVEQVCPAVEISPLPAAPANIVGLINVHGTMVVVVDLRKKLGMSEREIELSDQLIIVNADGRQFALLVDDVSGVTMVSAERVGGGHLSLGDNADDQVALYQLTGLLDAKEEEQLNQALELAFTER